MFAFRPLNLAANRISVKFFVKVLERRAQIQQVNGIGFRVVDSFAELRTQRPDVDIFDAPLTQFFFRRREPQVEIFHSIDGSQWSENGIETRRLPVSQLLMRQKTTAFCDSSPSAANV
jgi:hypothetical protein